MKNTSGNTFHAFKKHEAYILRKLDGPKRATREQDCDSQDVPRHRGMNERGRIWTF